MAGEGDTFILIILAIIFPPAAVAFLSGCGADVCLNLLLTLLGYLPGFLHAVWLILKRTEANQRFGYKNWRYSGMGEYTPQGAPAPSSGTQTTFGQPPAAAPPPPQEQYPAGGAPPPAQAGGYTQPPLVPPPSDVKYTYQAPPQAPPADQKVPVDQKQSEYQAPGQVPPAEQKAGADQKQSEGQAPGQLPADQKAIDVTPPPPADQK